MDTISQFIHDHETCATIKQPKTLKPLWYGGRWSKYRYGEAWQVDYIILPQTRQGKHYVLTMVEATTGWLEAHLVPHATARNTILGLEKQVLWQHGIPEGIESDNGTHFKNSLVTIWAKEHGMVYHIPYHAAATGKVEWCNGLLKTTLKALGGGTFKHWDQHLAKVTWSQVMSVLIRSALLLARQRKGTIKFTGLYGFDGLALAIAIDYLGMGTSRILKWYWWDFGVPAVGTEKTKQLSTLSGLSEDPSVVGLLCIKEQQVPIANMMVHYALPWQMAISHKPRLPGSHL
ncbi:hypothetical protein BTVI_65861 [Pitangus sulphuratus]|nr:hypothetical protein BTVI_65861 [Pitangus sulphuratus]